MKRQNRDYEKNLPTENNSKKKHQNPINKRRSSLSKVSRQAWVHREKIGKRKKDYQEGGTLKTRTLSARKTIGDSSFCWAKKTSEV